MIIYARKNRKTRGIVKLYKQRLHNPLRFIYWCRCSHGRKSVESNKSNAVMIMAHPDMWCSECERIVLQNEATLEVFNNTIESKM
jgi:hypothetical protein